MTGNKLTYGCMALFVLALLVPIASAVGYGTSSIALSANNVTVNVGSSAKVNYTVNLASGSTWGTTLMVLNQSQLSSQGITVTISNQMGEPPFSGTATIGVAASASSGVHQVAFAATGDDPSTNNTVLRVEVLQATTTTPQASTTMPQSSNQASNGTSTIIQTSTVASTSTVPGTYKYPPSNYDGTILLVLVAIIAIITAYLIMRSEMMSTKLIIIGIALILVGTAVWLYGDYSGGLYAYIWSGVAAILIGTVVWIIGDYRMMAAHKK